MNILFYKMNFMYQHLAYDQLSINTVVKSLSNDINIYVESTYKYLDKADVVVFDMPLFHHYWESDTNIMKPKHQIWVAWNFGCETIFPWINNTKIRSLFDIWMSYHSNSDIILPYYHYSYLDKLKKEQNLSKSKDICMFISSQTNNSGRLEYLRELMSHLEIDSYGKWMKNCSIKYDSGYKTKMEIIQNYKFTIAFENSIADDYVTEKFYEPLLAGSVPIYMGASNIEKFAPSTNCYIDVKDFGSPQKLASRIKELCSSPQLYQDMFKWKKLPWNRSFTDKIIKQKTHPIEKMIIISKFLLKNNID